MSCCIFLCPSFTRPLLLIRTVSLDSEPPFHHSTKSSSSVIHTIYTHAEAEFQIPFYVQGNTPVRPTVIVFCPNNGEPNCDLDQFRRIASSCQPRPMNFVVPGSNTQDIAKQPQRKLEVLFNFKRALLNNIQQIMGASGPQWIEY